jgi:[ribosomal protein S5]-alanine N-acetyltransferase
MDNLSGISTNRLFIKSLSSADDAFIFELLNTDEWKRFIGDRRIHSGADARAYIEKILASPEIRYWVVKLKGDGTSVGVVTLLKRNYLTDYDIGFAFLPGFFNKGYAFEATTAVLIQVVKRYALSQISAITALENNSSIRLLNRLGMKFHSEIIVDGKRLQLYSLNCLAGYEESNSKEYE